MKYHFGVGILSIMLAGISCSSSAQRNNQSTITNNGEIARSLPLPMSTPQIRSVDFAKLSYPNFPDYSDPNGRQKRRITLKAGEGGPNFINYGDVTGDGLEDAIVALGIDNHGSAIPDYVYVFTMENGKPKSIWEFETGDRADGGLRNVYVDNSQLVVELFGRDRVIGSQMYKGDEGLCCPGSFTRTRYRWTGKTFEEISSKVFDNPNGDANPTMPPYKPMN